MKERDGDKMTVKELKELLNKYPDEMDVVVKSGGNEDWCYNIWNGERANCKQGEILAEENDKDFDEKTCVLLLDATN